MRPIPLLLGAWLWLAAPAVAAERLIIPTPPPVPPSPTPIQPVIWFELPVSQIDRAKEFYGGLFGWRFEAFSAYDPTYWMIRTGEGGLGGAFVKRPRTGPTGGPVLYVEVPSLEPFLKKALRLGASLERPRTRLTAEVGEFAQIRDPDGNVIGLLARPQP